MTREIKILFNFTIYILLGFLICLIGLSNVFASEIVISGTAQFYDNSGSSVSSKTTEFENNRYFSTFTTVTNSYGGLVTFQLNTAIQKNRIYTIFILVGAESNGGTTIPSSKKFIGIGSNLSNANNSYINSINKVSYSAGSGTTSDTSRGVYYTFVANENGSYISVPYTTQYTCSNCRQYFSGYTLTDLGSSENMTSEEINSVINNQTNIINQNINNLNGTIKDTFEECRTSVNLYNPDEAYIIGASNQDIALNYYYDLKVGETYTFSTPHPWTSINVYDSNNNQIRSYGGIENSYKQSVTIQNGDSYLILIFNAGVNTNINNYDFTGVQFQKGSIATEYEPYGKEHCTNKIDETNDKLDETNNQLGDLNNNITNDNIDDNNISNAFNQFESFVDENATISTLLTLPVTLFSAILNGLQNSCTPFNLGSLYGEDLILPCINISNYLGTTLWTMIDIIISGFAIYFISKKFIKVFNNFSSMKEGDVIDD